MKKTTKDLLGILDELKKVSLSLFSLYFIALGLIYKYSYFQSFNINITTFISISDISVFFIEFIPFIFFFLFYLILIYCLLFFIINLFSKRKSNTQINEKEKKNTNSLAILGQIAAFFLFYISTNEHSFPLSISPYLKDIYSLHSLSERFFLTTIMVFLFILNHITIDNLKGLPHEVNLNKLKLINSFLFIFYLTGLSGTLMAGFKMIFHPTKAIEFNFNQKKISSQEINTVYVGSTSEYIFIFQKERATTKPYKKSEITGLTYFNDIITFHQDDIIEDKEINEYLEIDSLSLDAMKHYINLNDKEARKYLLKLSSISLDSTIYFNSKKKKILDLKKKATLKNDSIRNP